MPPFTQTSPYPRSLICVKSLPSILLLPAVCRVIAIGVPSVALSKSTPLITLVTPVKPCPTASLFGLEFLSNISVAVPSSAL